MYRRTRIWFRKLFKLFLTTAILPEQFQQRRNAGCQSLTSEPTEQAKVGVRLAHGFVEDSEDAGLFGYAFGLNIRSNTEGAMKGASPSEGAAVEDGQGQDLVWFRGQKIRRCAGVPYWPPAPRSSKQPNLRGT
jgi:hypothetical protein